MCRGVQRWEGRTGGFCCPRFHARTRSNSSRPPVGCLVFNASCVACLALAFEFSRRRSRRFCGQQHQAAAIVHPPSHPSLWRLPAVVVIGLPAFSNSSLWPHGVFTLRRSWNFTRASGLAFVQICGVQRSKHTGAEQQGRVLPIIPQTS